MKRSEPLYYLPWLVSRAAGIIAVVLISLSVLIGLAMATKMLRRPSMKRAAARLHEHIALVALAAIGLHGVTLLGDQWLTPGWRGITVPFALSYRPQFTGLGIIAGYLAVLLGPSFYVRRRLGARRWRKLHRATVVVWLLSVIHTLGAGSDGSKPWLRAVVLVPSVPIIYLLVLRILKGAPERARACDGQTSPTAGGAPRTEKPHRARAPIDTPLASSEVSTIPASGTVSSKKRRVAGISSAAT